MERITVMSMMDKQDNKRDAPISIRVPKEHLDEFNRRVEKSGLSRNAFVLKCVLDCAPMRSARSPRIEKQLLAKLLAKAAQIHSELQQLSASDRVDPNVLDQANTTLIEIRAAILVSLERKP